MASYCQTSTGNGLANPVPKPTNSPKPWRHCCILEDQQSARQFAVEFRERQRPEKRGQRATLTLPGQRAVGPVSVVLLWEALRWPAATNGPGGYTDHLGRMAIRRENGHYPLLNNPVIAASKTITAQLSGAVNGSLGATADSTLSINEPPFMPGCFRASALGQYRGTEVTR